MKKFYHLWAFSNYADMEEAFLAVMNKNDPACTLNPNRKEIIYLVDDEEHRHIFGVFQTREDSGKVAGVQFCNVSFARDNIFVGDVIMYLMTRIRCREYALPKLP